MLVVLVVIGLLVVIGWMALGGGSSPIAKTEALRFSEDMFDPAAIDHIAPLGELNGGYEEAGAIASILLFIKREYTTDGKGIAIRAPTTMELERYSYHNVPGEAGVTNWTLVFRLSADVTLKMDHITSVSNKILAATAALPKDTPAEESPTSELSFEPGETIAHTTGTSQAHNWNIYVYDARQTNSFVNQKRYEQDETGERLVTARCPFDFYDESRKAVFLDLMGQAKAGEAATCGQVSRDVKGALSGMWHFSADPGDGTGMDKSDTYTSPLSIYKNAADAVIVHQVDGKRLDIEPGNKTHKDPAGVTAEHCYQLNAGYAFFKIISDTQMALAYKNAGRCPASFPDADARTYYR